MGISLRAPRRSLPFPGVLYLPLLGLFRETSVDLVNCTKESGIQQRQ
jgi:hypothetical protein